MQLGFIFSLIFAIIITIFALQNSDPVKINFLFANIEISQALVIFISAVCGAIIVAILGFYKNLKVKINLKKANKEIKGLETENSDLKSKINDLQSSLTMPTVPVSTKAESNLGKSQEIEPTEDIETEENTED